MRIWSLHPRLLDRQGLVALWREGLLARKVLAGATRGYRNHPQLTRFRTLDDPVAGMDRYLSAVLAEAEARGYRFNATKIVRLPAAPLLAVTTGQLDYELAHLRRKLAQRSPERVAALPAGPEPHPCFTVEPGPVAEWERTG